MGRMFDVSFRIGGAVAGSFKASFGSASNQMGKLQLHTAKLAKQFRELNATQAQIGKFKELKAGLQQTQKKLQETQEKIKGLAKELKDSSKSAAEIKKIQKEFDTATKEAAKLKAEFSSQQMKAQQLRSSLAAVGVSTRNLADDEKKLADQIKKVSEQQEKAEQTRRKMTEARSQTNDVRSKRKQTGEQFVSAGRQVVGAAAIATPLIMAAKAAINFESAMADVNKVLNIDPKSQEYAKMSDSILDLSRRVPIAADGLAQIVAAGGQAGIAKQDLLGFAESAAKMGVAFDISADEAGQMMAVWRTTFKMSQKEVEGLADQVNYLSNNSPVTASKISEIVSRVGSLGGLAGFTAGQVAALGAALPHVEPEVAATGLKKVFTTLTAGEAATKGQAQAMHDLGLNTVQMAKLMQTDAQAGLMKFLGAIKKLPKEKQLSYLKQIVGEEGLSAIGPAVNNLDLLQKNLTMAGDKSKYAGSMQQEFDARSKTTANSLQLLKNNTSAIGIEMGNVLLPTINDLVGKASEVATKISDWSEKHPNLTKALVLGGVAVTGVSVGIGLASAAMAGFNMVMLASPITWIAAGVAAIAVGAYLLYHRYATVRKVVDAGAKALWGFVKFGLRIAIMHNPITLIIKGLKFLYDKFDFLKKPIDAAYKAFKAKFPKFTGDLEKIGKSVGKLIDKFKKLIGLKGKAEKENSGKGGNAKAGKKIAKNAKGGIYQRGAFLTTFAEDSPEAAIPLDGSPRAIGLWRQAGKMLGAESVALPEPKRPLSPPSPKGLNLTEKVNRLFTTRKSGDVYIDYHPVYHGMDEKKLTPIQKQHSNDLEKRLKEIQAQKDRTAYK